MDTLEVCYGIDDQQPVKTLEIRVCTERLNKSNHALLFSEIGEKAAAMSTNAARLDLSRVTFFNSSCLGALFNIVEAFRENHTPLTLKISDTLHDLMDTARAEQWDGVEIVRD